MSGTICIAETPQRETRFSEKALSRIWERVGALPDGLVAQDGTRYKVIYPGRSNSRAGPDFLDAVLLDGSNHRVRGDVEIHLNAPDWYSHQVPVGSQFQP